MVALCCQLTSVPPEDAHSTGLVPRRSLTENVCLSTPPSSLPQPASLQGASDGLRVRCSVLWWIGVAFYLFHFVWYELKRLCWLRCDSFPIMAWFGVCSGNWCVGGWIRGGGVEEGVCVFERVMTSLSMHASIFCCVYFTAASNCWSSASPWF